MRYNNLKIYELCDEDQHLGRGCYGNNANGKEFQNFPDMDFDSYNLLNKLEGREHDGQINGKAPSETFMLYATADNCPDRIMIVDEQGTVGYFYCVDRPEVRSANLGNPVIYGHRFILDEWMTFCFSKHDTLRSQTNEIKFLRKNNDGFDYSNNPNYGLDFYTQFGLRNVNPTFNILYEKKFIKVTNEEQLYQMNFNTACPSSVPTKAAIVSAADGTVDLRAPYTMDSIINRYFYLVLKTSALSTPNNIPQTANVLVLPVTRETMRRLKGNANLNIGSGNVIGFFNCDYPPILKNRICNPNYNDPIFNKLYTIETSSGISGGIVFWALDMNDIETFTIAQTPVATNDNSIIGVLQTMLSNVSDRTNILNHPYLLNPKFKRDVILYDNDKYISIDALSIKFNENLETTNLKIRLNVQMYDSCYAYYDFGFNTNGKNTELNAGESNFRTEIGFKMGFMTDAFDDGISTNVTTENTARANIQQTFDTGVTIAKRNIVQRGIDASADAIGNIFRPLTNIKNGIKNATGMQTDAANIRDQLNLQRDIANRNLESMIENVKSSPSTVVSVPYIEASTPSKQYTNTDGTTGYLFPMFSIEANDQSKKTVMTDVLEHGDYFVNLAPYNDYDVNSIRNSFLIDTNYMTEDMCQHLVGTDKFSTLNYIERFIGGYIGAGVKLGKSPAIYSTTEFNNVENDNFADERTSITAGNGSDKNLGQIPNDATMNEVITLAKSRNPNITQAQWDACDWLGFTQEHIRLSAKPGTAFKDYVIFDFTRTPRPTTPLKTVILKSNSDWFNDATWDVSGTSGTITLTCALKNYLKVNPTFKNTGHEWKYETHGDFEIQVLDANNNRVTVTNSAYNNDYAGQAGVTTFQRSCVRTYYQEALFGIAAVQANFCLAPIRLGYADFYQNFTLLDILTKDSPNNPTGHIGTNSLTDPSNGGLNCYLAGSAGGRTIRINFTK